MSIVKRAEIDATGFNVSNDLAMQGELSIRWAKLTYLDGQLVARENHRTVLQPEHDVDTTMQAIRDDLVGQGFDWDVFEADVDFVKLLTDRFWTDEVLAAREAMASGSQPVTAEAP